MTPERIDFLLDISHRENGHMASVRSDEFRELCALARRGLEKEVMPNAGSNLSGDNAVTGAAHPTKRGLEHAESELDAARIRDGREHAAADEWCYGTKRDAHGHFVCANPRHEHAAASRIPEREITPPLPPVVGRDMPERERAAAPSMLTKNPAPDASPPNVASPHKTITATAQASDALQRVVSGGVSNAIRPAAAATMPEDSRQCTCYPGDNPPTPCPRKFALTECFRAHAEGLRAEIEVMMGVLDSVTRRAEKAEAELGAARERLEIGYGFDADGNRIPDVGGPDGIECRDETIRQQDKQIDLLRAELDAARKDAQRYRWLRNSYGVGMYDELTGRLCSHYREHADTAIDAAIERAGEKT